MNEYHYVDIKSNWNDINKKASTEMCSLLLSQNCDMCSLTTGRKFDKIKA